MSLLRGVKLLGTNNEEIESYSGSLNVNISGVNAYMVNTGFHTHTAISSTLSVATTIGAIQLTVASSTGFAIGNLIQILGLSNVDNSFTNIINIIGNVLYINRPVGHINPIGTVIVKIISDMSSVSGSVASPASYKIVPSVSQKWKIEKLMLSMTHASAGDLGLFGGIAELGNGCILRKYNSDGTFSTFTNWKTNADIYLDFANIEFAPRSGAHGSYGTVGSGSLIDIGVAVIVDGLLGEYLEVLIQDDLTTLNGFYLKAQGYLVQ